VKRVGGLWPGLVSWENIASAIHRAAAGKKSRPDVAEFLLAWELHAIELQRQLAAETYTPGTYRTFLVREPKPRMISAAPFRDRVVHHILTQVLEPIFEPRFAAQSYACRTELGTHRALRAASAACRRFPYVLQCDIRKYFHSIDHEILKVQLAHAVKCQPTLRLAAKIIDGSNPQESVTAYFPGDTLFTPCERPRGLPLGNQTSQFFSNLYLNQFDQFVLRDLRPGAYCRYVDDFLIFHDSKDFLRDARQQVQAQMDRLRLVLHEGKSRIYRTQDGITFLGWRLFPDHRLELGRSCARIASWNAHAAHGDTWRLREQLFAAHAFKVRGHS